MCTHLHRRGNRYYIRRRVPLDLVPHYKRLELTKALGTSDYTEAKALCRRADVQLDDEFNAIRHGVPTQAPMPPATAAPTVVVPCPTPASAITPAAPVAPPAPHADTATSAGISLSKLAEKWEAERKPSDKSAMVTRRIIKSFESLVRTSVQGKSTPPVRSHRDKS
jgi:hypothetical protein